MAANTARSALRADGLANTLRAVNFKLDAAISRSMRTRPSSTSSTKFHITAWLRCAAQPGGPTGAAAAADAESAPTTPASKPPHKAGLCSHLDAAVSTAEVSQPRTSATANRPHADVAVSSMLEGAAEGAEWASNASASADKAGAVRRANHSVKGMVHTAVSRVWARRVSPPRLSGLAPKVAAAAALETLHTRSPSTHHAAAAYREPPGGSDAAAAAAAATAVDGPGEGPGAEKAGAAAGVKPGGAGGAVDVGLGAAAAEETAGDSSRDNVAGRGVWSTEEPWRTRDGDADGTSAGAAPSSWLRATSTSKVRCATSSASNTDAATAASVEPAVRTPTSCSTTHADDPTDNPAGDDGAPVGCSSAGTAHGSALPADVADAYPSATLRSSSIQNDGACNRGSCTLSTSCSDGETPSAEDCFSRRDARNPAWSIGAGNNTVKPVLMHAVAACCTAGTVAASSCADASKSASSNNNDRKSDHAAAVSEGEGGAGAPSDPCQAEPGRTLLATMA